LQAKAVAAHRRNAIRCFAHEISFRGIRNWPEVTDEADGPNLAGWRDYVRLNA
jgi:hypothetical protein